MVAPAVMDIDDKMICDFSASRAAGCTLLPMTTAATDAPRKRRASIMRITRRVFIDVA